MTCLTSGPSRKRSKKISTNPDLYLYARRLLYTLRKERGISQTTMAQYLGISQTQLSKIELGKVHISAVQALHICEFFGITIQELFYEHA